MKSWNSLQIWLGLHCGPAGLAPVNSPAGRSSPHSWVPATPTHGIPAPVKQTLEARSIRQQAIFSQQDGVPQVEPIEGLATERSCQQGVLNEARVFAEEPSERQTAQAEQTLCEAQKRHEVHKTQTGKRTSANSRLKEKHAAVEKKELPCIKNWNEVESSKS